MIIHEERASAGQRMLWLVQRQQATGGGLNYPLLLRLRGRLDLGRLQRALDALAARHEALRTTFGRRQGLPAQLIHAPDAVPVRVTAVRPASETALRERIDQEIATPIDPALSPLRVTLWALDDADHVLCLNAHHLIMDAWSCRILLEDLLCLLDGSAALPRPGWQYRHFVQWQQRRTTIERSRADRAYWQRQLAGIKPSSLPVRAGAPPSAPAPNGTIEFAIGPGTWASLQRLARSESTSPFAVLLSAYYAALHHECGDTDLSVCAPFANRTRPELLRTVGFFANMLLLRIRVVPGTTFLEIVRSTRSTVTGALAHQGFGGFTPPGQTHTAGERRLQDLVFQMLPGLPPPAVIGDVEVTVLPPIAASRFDVELSVVSHGDGIRALLQYSPRRVEPALAESLAARARSIISRAAGSAGFPI